MKLLAVFGLILTTFSQCNKARNWPDPSIPSCVQLRISEIKIDGRWNPPAEVNEYLYNGKKVYLFSADCCDQFLSLIDSSCNTLCAPSGGITGKGDGKCPDFYQKAQHLRLIWKDDR